ncbi:MAG: cupin domain-containing protein [Ardenticatenaceae bacterium]|nr:cupin domain-containing protein [Anaerolineales bacterium]MCB8920134.1 cupin domain-containing protein [Ardenticatenaceae bacterium]MCB8992196.1 cupin domain-containing protein [Ardenticatenaceae bacterium]MCB9005073.1 cupin domain-containing protein [Ardenticatenaceae bacterium]
MISFNIAQLLEEQQQMKRPYHEFLRRRSMSMGVYVLPAGSEDPQQPHQEDEVYLVLEGAATLRVANKDQKITKGSLIFVPAFMPHHFHSILEDLQVLVFFAPAETQSTL